jgi:DNA replication protein DnaC
MTDSFTIPTAPSLRSFEDIVRGVLESMPDEEEAARQTAAAEAKERTEREERRGASWMQFAGRRYAGCCFDNFEVPTAALSAARNACYEHAVALAGGTMANLMIAGPVGSGKDDLATSVCHNLFSAGWEWIADTKRAYGAKTLSRVTGVGLFAEWRDAMKAGAEVELRNRFTRPDLLVVSDPAGAADRLTEFQAAALLSVVDGRYEAIKPMIVTVNIADRAGLYQLLTPPVADRLLHDARIVVVNSPSWRTRDGG